MKKIILAFIFALAAPALGETLTVKSLVGAVKYDGKPVKAGDKISPGALLEVDSAPETMVDILYPAGHHLRLKKGANLKINGSGNNLDLIRGQVFAYFAKDKGAEKIKIKTRSVVAGVRGTKYMIEEDKTKGTYICVCDGVVRVFSKEKPFENPVNVKAGQDLWANLRGPGWSGNALDRPKDSPGMAETTSGEFKSMGY